MANTEPRPSHETWVQAQFGPAPAAYVESPLHAKGEDLDYIAALAGARTPDRALDLGCGGGHVAYTIAPHCTEVVACDLSIDMVTSAAKTAQERGLGNITGKVAAAEGLPFGDREFDFLACRMTAHHWRDLERGLREARRVLKPGAPAVFVDVIAPEDPIADVHLQTVELLRDPSHVRDYRASEWLAALGREGFHMKRMRTHRLRMQFDWWIARMAPPECHVASIRSLQNRVSAQ